MNHGVAAARRAGVTVSIGPRGGRRHLDRNGKWVYGPLPKPMRVLKSQKDIANAKAHIGTSLGVNPKNVRSVHVFSKKSNILAVAVVYRKDRDKPTYKYATRGVQKRADKRIAREILMGRSIKHLVTQARKDVSHMDPKRRNAAVAFLLMDHIYIRNGAGGHPKPRQDGTIAYGATDLLVRHLRQGSPLGLHFPGKSHHLWDRQIKDAQLARALRENAKDKKPNDRLIHVSDQYVNDYIRTHLPKGSPLTAKDVRTFHENKKLHAELKKAPKYKTEEERKEHLMRVMEERIAPAFGHSVGVAMQSYINPALVAKYLKGGAL